MKSWTLCASMSFTFSDKLRGNHKMIEGVTRYNALFLSVAAQYDYEQVGDVFNWFLETEIPNYDPDLNSTVDQFLEQARAQTDGKPELPYPLVLDKDFAITDRLDIRGDLAKPSTYILDKKGDLVYAYVGANPTDRPSIKAVLNQLEQLQNAK